LWWRRVTIFPPALGGVGDVRPRDSGFR
jgi:hypothetical protein